MQANVLYYGNNLDILRRYVPDASVDLVYLDPPFNSNATYNVIFKDESGRQSDAQLLAFDDTWHWGPDAEEKYAYLTNTARHQGRVPSQVGALVAALRQGINPSPMLAYLVEMAVRLIELHRVLRPTGSLYLHCDPTASHYLKLVLDAIFGPEDFVAEIVWRRTNARGTTGRWPRLHDIILHYGRSSDFFFSAVRVQADEARMPHTLVTASDGLKYQSYELTAPGATKSGDSGTPWHGFAPAQYGRHWANSHTQMDEWDAQGLIHWPPQGGWPRRRAAKPFEAGDRYVVVGDVWSDIDRLNQTAKERLGYPTQKPVALLERIISASSNPGDIVLDPFCGCGTALVAAQKLGRQWIGIDVTYLAIAVMRARLKDSFGLAEVPVIGQPTEVAGARQLLKGTGLEGQYQFQWWALDLIGAQPQGGVQKKGADRGIDGVISFSTGPRGEVGRALVSVKSGTVNSGMVRDLKGVLEREHAEIGLFVTLEEPSGPMRQEAATAGVYHSALSGRDYPRVQLLSIRELLEEHRRPDLPLLVLPAYQQAQPVKKAAEQAELFGA